jgi:hypothetical protein
MPIRVHIFGVPLGSKDRKMGIMIGEELGKFMDVDV